MIGVIRGVNRRKCVMGNGRRLGRTSGSSLLCRRALGSMFVLLLAGAVLLGLGSRRYAQKPVAQAAASPIPTASRSSSHANSHANSDARAILGQLPLIF